MSRATQIDRVTAKGQLVPLVFMQADVAASQTDVQLSVAAVDNAADDQLAVVGYTMPFEGEIVAITADLSAAATAGTLTVGPTVGGTEKVDPTLSITTQTTRRDAARRGTAVFNAGDIIGAEITTGGTWDGITADLLVTVWVILHLEGI
jgi:hypothetical protein